MEGFRDGSNGPQWTVKLREKKWMRGDPGETASTRVTAKSRTWSRDTRRRHGGRDRRARRHWRRRIRSRKANQADQDRSRPIKTEHSESPWRISTSMRAVSPTRRGETRPARVRPTADRFDRSRCSHLGGPCGEASTTPVLLSRLRAYGDTGHQLLGFLDARDAHGRMWPESKS